MEGGNSCSDLKFRTQKEQRIEASYEGSGNGGISELFSAPLPRNRALFSLGAGGLDLLIFTTFPPTPSAARPIRLCLVPFDCDISPLRQMERQE